MGYKKHDDLHHEELEAFVGDKVKYYKKKWNDHPVGLFGGWNWASFFFGVGWMVYRRMYKVVCLEFLIILSIIVFSFFLPSLPRQICQRIIVDIIYWIFIICGNGLYRQKYFKTLEKTQGMKQTQRIDFLKAKGGTSRVGAVLVGILSIAYIVYEFIN